MGTYIADVSKTGVVTGTHLHFGVSIGNPRGGGRFYNPMTLYK